MATIEQALNELLPGVEWKITDGDLTTLEIFTEGIKAPTQTEINQTIKAIDLAVKKEAETKAIAKAALLERLGITEDEAKLLLS